MASPKATSNPFHDIRKRELRRERMCLQGQPAEVQPSYFIPSLKEICAQVIAATFDQQKDIDALRELDPNLYLLIIDQLRTDLPLTVSVPRVKEQDYWKSCAEARWTSGQLHEFVTMHLDANQAAAQLAALSPALSGVNSQPSQSSGAAAAGQVSAAGERSGQGAAKGGKPAGGAAKGGAAASSTQGGISSHPQAATPSVDPTSGPSTTPTATGTGGLGAAVSGGSGGLVAGGGVNWRRLFLEHHLAEHLMGQLKDLTLSETDDAELQHQCALCASDVTRLYLPKLRCHVNFAELATRLPHLRSLYVSFGVLNAGVMYSADMLGLRDEDANRMQLLLKSSPNLTSLSLPENAIGGEACRALVAGLVRNKTLRYLDLSHNMIEDTGAHALGVILLQKELNIHY